MIRPEHVVFVPGALGNGPASGEPGMLRLEGEVTDDVFIGEHRLLHVATEAGQIIAGNRPDAGGARLAPGTAGVVQCRLADMMVFAM